MALKIHETEECFNWEAKDTGQEYNLSSQNAITYFAGEEEKQIQDYFERIGEEDS